MHLRQTLKQGRLPFPQMDVWLCIRVGVLRPSKLTFASFGIWRLRTTLPGLHRTSLPTECGEISVLSNFDLWERFKTTKLGLAGDLWVLNPVRQAGKTTHGTFLASSSRGSGQLKTPITGMDKIGPGQSNSMSDSYGIRLGRFRLRGAPFSVQKDLLMRSFVQWSTKSGLFRSISAQKPRFR